MRSIKYLLIVILIFVFCSISAHGGIDDWKKWQEGDMTLYSTDDSFVIEIPSGVTDLCWHIDEEKGFTYGFHTVDNFIFVFPDGIEVVIPQEELLEWIKSRIGSDDK